MTRSILHAPRAHAVFSVAIATGLLFGCGGLLSGCGGNVGPSAQMSLRRVVLYQNGLGYFERTGDIAQPSLPLRFSAHEIDDVLATMTLQSRDGQTVVSASVPQRREGEQDGDVVTIDLRLSQESARDLTLSYSVPTPAWRGSYRVVLPEGPGEGQALFQIWALVHNSSPEDWNRVQLALSTGAPISYEIDQRTPEFVARPNASGQLVAPTILGTIIAESSRPERALGPVAVADADGVAPMAAMPRAYRPAAPGVEASSEAGAAVFQSRVLESPALGAAPTSLPIAIEGTTRYDVAAPVSIPARSSSLVTILSEPVRGESVLLFAPNPAAPGSEQHPFRAARIHTPSTTTLIPGPVAIFAGGSFVGQALVNALHEGETATLPYAIDGATRVIVTDESATEPSRLVSIARGVMTVEDRSIRRTRFEIRTGARAPGRIFIRHQRLAGHTPRGLPEGTEETETALLMPLSIESTARTELVIEETTPVRRSFTMMADLRAPVMPYVEASGELPAELRARLRDVIALRARVGEAEERVVNARERVADETQRTAELRRNLEALGERPSDARRELEARLRDASAGVERLQQELSNRQGEAANARAQLSEAISRLTMAPAD